MKNKTPTKEEFLEKFKEYCSMPSGREVVIEDMLETTPADSLDLAEFETDMLMDYDLPTDHIDVLKNTRITLKEIADKIYDYKHGEDTK